jgi:glycosyltransferase involved in cell wall biosynthesis
MPAVLTALLSSPLAERYRLEAIPSYRDARPLGRLLVFARSLGALGRWCAGRGPRIVHVHVAVRGSFYRKGVVVALVKAMRRPVVLQLHAGPGDLEDFLGGLGGLRRRTFGLAFRRADRVLSVSEGGAAVLRGWLPGLDVSVVRNAPPPLVPRDPGREDATEPLVLYLGGFADPAKGGTVLFEALPALLERVPEVRVALAGPGEPPGPLPDRVRWLGWLDPAAKEAALVEADVFAMPSISEGLPVALLEAMAHELPIVASAVGGIGEILDDGADALLVAPGDAAGLVEALGSLLLEPEWRRRLGSAASASIARLGDEDVYAKLEAVYEDVLARR